MAHALTQHASLAHLRQRRCAWLLVACLLLFVALVAPACWGLIYVHDDLGAFHIPVRAFFTSCLLHGQPFDWMPHLFNGFYLIGEGQAGTYHPVHQLLYRGLPFTTAFNVNLLISYPLMFLGTYWFLLRRVHRRDAALLGGLLFTFSGFNLLHFAHMNAVAVVAHIPWQLWAIDVALRCHDRRRRLAAELLVALLTASQVLLGYPQYVWLSLVAETAYATLLIISHPGYVRRAGWLVVAKLLGFLLGAVQLLPTIDALFTSARHDADAAFAAWGSLAPLNLIQLVAPYASATRVVGQNTHELGLYFGAVPLLLVVWLLAPRRQPGRLRRFGWIAACCAGAGLLLALGNYGPLHPYLSRLPLIGNFRFPCRAIVLVHFSLAVAATAAWVDLARRLEQRQYASFRQLVPLWCVAALSLLVTLWAVSSWNSEHRSTWLLLLAGPALFVIAACLLTAAARGSHAALIAAALVAAVDLGTYGLSYSVYPHVASFEQYLARASLPPGNNRERMAGDLLHFDQAGLRLGDQALLAGYRRVDGYLGLEPARVLDYRTLPALQLSGVRWIASAAAVEHLDLRRANNDWYELSAPLPRARCVTHAHYTHDPASRISSLALDRNAAVERLLPLDGGPPATVEIVADRAGCIELRVDSPSQQLLVLAESFHSGWQAHVDGRPVEVYRVNGDFLGCVVDRHTKIVNWTFRPASLRRGWHLSLIGLAATAGFAFIRFQRTRTTDCIP